MHSFWQQLDKESSKRTHDILMKSYLVQRGVSPQLIKPKMTPRTNLLNPSPPRTVNEHPISHIVKMKHKTVKSVGENESAQVVQQNSQIMTGVNSKRNHFLPNIKISRYIQNGIFSETGPIKTVNTNNKLSKGMYLRKHKIRLVHELLFDNYKSLVYFCRPEMKIHMDAVEEVHKIIRDRFDGTQSSLCCIDIKKSKLQRTMAILSNHQNFTKKVYIQIPSVILNI